VRCRLRHCLRLRRGVFWRRFYFRSRRAGSQVGLLLTALLSTRSILLMVASLAALSCHCAVLISFSRLAPFTPMPSLMLLVVGIAGCCGRCRRTRCREGIESALLGWAVLLGDQRYNERHAKTNCQHRTNNFHSLDSRRYRMPLACGFETHQGSQMIIAASIAQEASTSELTDASPLSR